MIGWFLLALVVVLLWHCPILKPWFGIWKPSWRAHWDLFQ